MTTLDPCARCGESAASDDLCGECAQPVRYVHIRHADDGPDTLMPLGLYLSDNEGDDEWCARLRALKPGERIEHEGATISVIDEADTCRGYCDIDERIVTMVRATHGYGSCPGCGSTHPTIEEGASPPAPAAVPVPVESDGAGAGLTLESLHARAHALHTQLAALETDIGRSADRAGCDDRLARALAFADVAAGTLWRVVCALGAELDR